GARGAADGQHDARGHPEGPRRSRFARGAADRGRRRQRRGPGQVRVGRSRRGRARETSPGRGRQVLRRFVARAHERHRIQECGPRKGELTMATTTTNSGRPTARGPRKGKPKTATTTASKTATNGRLTARPSWKALREHHEKIQSLHLRTLFAED